MPLLDLIWVMLIWFLFFAWIVVITGVVTDVFRSEDLNGAAKAGWVLFVIVIPWLGVVVYLIARGEALTARYLEALGKSNRNKTLVDPRSGKTLAATWLHSPDARRTGVAGALGSEVQSARIMR